MTNKLKTIRKQHAFTQEQVAEGINIDVRAYARLERGETSLQRNTFLNLAKFYGYEGWEFELLNNTNTTNNQYNYDSSTGQIINQTNDTEFIKSTYELLHSLKQLVEQLYRNNQ